MPGLRRATLHLHPILTMTIALIAANCIAALALLFVVPVIAALEYGWLGALLAVLIGWPLAGYAGKCIEYLESTITDDTKEPPTHD